MLCEGHGSQENLICFSGRCNVRVWTVPSTSLCSINRTRWEIIGCKTNRRTIPGSKCCKLTCWHGEFWNHVTKSKTLVNLLESICCGCSLLNKCTIICLECCLSNSIGHVFHMMNNPVIASQTQIISGS